MTRQKEDGSTRVEFRKGDFIRLGSSVDFLLETIPSLKNEPSNESRWNAISNGIFDSRSF